MTMPPSVIDYSSSSYGNISLRYCGTIHLHTVYATEKNFDCFLKMHPRNALHGIVTIVLHTPASEEPLLGQGGGEQDSCMDVWVACQDDNTPSGIKNLPVIATKVIERWRASTTDLRRDDLRSNRLPEHKATSLRPPQR